MKSEMKQTEVGAIPADWEVVKLGQISQRVKAKNDGSEHGILTISAKTGFVRQADRYSRYMAGKSVENYTLLKKGQFSYNKGNPLTYPFGCTYRLDSYTQALVPNVYISFKTSDEADSEFLKHLFLEGTFIGRLEKYITSGVRGNGLLNVNPEDFFSLQLALPPIPEQQKIAEILSTVDEKLAVIDKQLAQTQELKNGLMQRLLTKGIGHTAFKDSPLGQIPQSWEVVELGSASDITRLAGYEYSEYWKEDPEGVIMSLRGYNIGRNTIIHRDIVRISNDLSLQLSRSRLNKGDVVFPCVGSIGNAVVIEESDKYHINQNITKLTPNSSLSSYYLVHYLMSDICKSEIRRLSASSSQPNVLVGSLRKFRIALPSSIEEQANIAEIFSTIDAKLQVLTDKKVQYQELKLGLMQQLLTGQRRVRVASEEEAIA